MALSTPMTRLLVGHFLSGRPLLMVHAGNGVSRIISARRVTKSESRSYESDA